MLSFVDIIVYSIELVINRAIDRKLDQLLKFDFSIYEPF